MLFLVASRSQYLVFLAMLIYIFDIYLNMLVQSIFSTLITCLFLFGSCSKHVRRMRCSSRLLERYKVQLISLKIAR